MAFTVGELSRLTGVTVRALHHYDELGLVRASERSAAGYRLYSGDDVLRLQQVLVLRALGVGLAEIGAVLDSETDRAALLRKHRGELAERRTRIDTMLAAVDAAISVLDRTAPPFGGADARGQAPTVEGVTAMTDKTTDKMTDKATDKMTSDDFKAMFDGFDPAEYEAEAAERWGGTDAHQESTQRAQGYGKAEWAEIQAEQDANYARLRELMQRGAAPSDPAVQAAVEDHRRHIDRWFYPCSREMHHGLGEMYVADQRFTANLDKVVPGFARFLRDAIAAS